MRIIFLLCFVFSMGFSNPVKNFTQTLTDQQKSLLNNFVLALVDGPSGYVLYGSKPMHIEEINFPKFQSLSSLDWRLFSLMKGRELWKDLEIDGKDKTYLLNIFEIGNQVFFVSMNRKAMIETIEKNLTLFQYILGHSVNSTSLFEALVNSEDRFFEVLKNNQVLIEILSGNSQQNAIAYSRLMQIQDPSLFGNVEEFPIISKRMIRNWAIAPNRYKVNPSFGYQSVNQEELALNQMSSLSDYKNYHLCQLPDIVCMQKSDETRELLNLYQENRVSLILALEEGSYFENTLEKFLTKTSGTVVTPKVPAKALSHVPEMKDELMQQLVRIIRETISKEPFGAKKCIKSFLKGVLAREKDEDWPPESRKTRTKRTRMIQEELRSCENLKRADLYFEELKDRLDLTALIPEKLYYKTLKPGKGKVATSKLQKVSIQFAYQLLGKERSKDWGMIKDEHIGALIPGIAYALIGMQLEEERAIYIHPSYGYGETSFFPPNATIVAQIRLLDFTEGDQTAVVFPPHKLQKYDYKDLLVKYEVLRSEEYYYDGLEFWDNIKKSQNFFSFHNFYKTFLSDSENLSPLEERQVPYFINDFGYLLITLQK